jgi:6-phosphogluconolactonase
VNRRLAFLASLCVSYCLLFLSSVAPAQTTATTSASPVTQAVDRYAYAVEANGAQQGALLVSYSINPQTGYLRPLESIQPLPSGSFGIAAHPSNRFVYVADGPQILGYALGGNGLLRSLSGSPFQFTGGSVLVFTPNGKFAYSNFGTELSVNLTTGALTKIGTAKVSGNPYYVAINSSGSFVYILNYGQETISAFSVNQTSGVLTEITGSPFAAGEGFPVSEVVSPDGKLLFVATQPSSNPTLGSTAVFSINSTTGALTPVTGSPFSTPGGGNGIVVDPTSKFLYFAGNNLSAYSIDATTGALTGITGSPYALSVVANNLKVDPTGKFLYVSMGNGSVAGVITYSINSSTGALKQIGTDGAALDQVNALAIATGSKAVVYTPKFAYATNQGSKTISEWTINDATGALTAIAGSPLADINGPQFIATSPSGAFVYTGNSNNSISEYKVNATTGALTPVSGSPITGFGSVNGMAIDPSSSFLYVLDSAKQLVDTYTVNSKNGALSFLSSAATLAQAHTITLDPAGVMTVVTNSTTIQVTSGGSFPTTTSITASHPPTAIVVDQSSQYILAAEAAGKTVLTLAFGSNGSLTQLSSAPTGNNPSATLAEPSGKYVYVANSGDGTISCYSLNNSTGALSQIGSAVEAAAGTDSLATSNDGKYLYATDNAAGLVSIFKINTTGTLTAAGSATTGTSPTSIATTGTNK